MIWDGKGFDYVGPFWTPLVDIGVSGTGEALAFETLQVCKRTNYEDTSDASSGLPPTNRVHPRKPSSQAFTMFRVQGVQRGQR